LRRAIHDSQVAIDAVKKNQLDQHQHGCKLFFLNDELLIVVGHD
jgi:hypothetical protein